MHTSRTNYRNRNSAIHSKKQYTQLYVYMDRWQHAPPHIQALWPIAGVFDKEGNPVALDNPDAYYFSAAAALALIRKNNPQFRYLRVESIFNSHLYMPERLNVGVIHSVITQHVGIHRKDLERRGLVPRLPKSKPG